MPVLSVAKIMARKGPLMRLPLLIASLRSMRQARRLPGFIKGEAGHDRDGIFFTVTLWDDEEALRNYVHTGVHGGAIKRMQKWGRCHVSSNIPWEHDQLIGWAAVEDLLREQGRVIDLPHVGDLTHDEKVAGPVSAMRRAIIFSAPSRGRQST